jgi:hypothetical protein
VECWGFRGDVLRAEGTEELSMKPTARPAMGRKKGGLQPACPAATNPRRTVLACYLWAWLDVQGPGQGTGNGNCLRRALSITPRLSI